MSEANTGMHSVRSSQVHGERFERVYVWELPVRLYHWINASCITMLFFTGLYIAHPVLVSSGEAWNNFVMGWMRELHFAAAYIFTFTFLWRAIWVFFGNDYARTGAPLVWRWDWWSSVLRQASQYLRLRTGHPHIGHNALAGLSYALFIVALGLAQILTGFALYSLSSPGGFWDGLVGWVVPLLGGPFNTAMWHHLFAWGFLVFVILHVYIVLLDSREFRNGLIGSMVHGHKFRPTLKDDSRED